LYNCFGCGVAGNALTFLKEYENLTAGEALKELSRQTGIELPKEPINKSHTYKKTPVAPKPAVAQARASSHQSPAQALSDSDVAECPAITNTEALWIDAFDDFQTSDNLAASFIPFSEYDDASVGGFSPFDDMG
ncbi:CHC2 zinc finger domain-containing protein, partial [Xanthomonas citri pv. citri]